MLKETPDSFIIESKAPLKQMANQRRTSDGASKTNTRQTAVDLLWPHSKTDQRKHTSPTTHKASPQQHVNRWLHERGNLASEMCGPKQRSEACFELLRMPAFPLKPAAFFVSRVIHQLGSSQKLRLHLRKHGPLLMASSEQQQNSNRQIKS